MKKKIYLLRLSILISCGFMLSGCVSAVIVGGGKNYRHLLKEDTTVSEVRDELGTPVKSWTYEPPVPYEETQQVRDFTGVTGYTPTLYGGPEGKYNSLVSTIDVYMNQGPYQVPERGQGYGMVSGMTLGLAEIFLIPMAISDRMEMNKGVHYVTFWYDENRKVLGSMLGNIDLKNDNNPRQ